MILYLKSNGLSKLHRENKLQSSVCLSIFYNYFVFTTLKFTSPLVMKTNSSVSILPKKCRSRTKGSRCYALPRKQEERIKTGLRYNNPAAMVVWAITRIPASEKGVTGRRLINFMKRHYEATNDPGGTGKSLGALLRYAVTFGLLAKRGNKYFLAVKYT